jgi:hypothetical protein
MRGPFIAYKLGIRIFWTVYGPGCGSLWILRKCYIQNAQIPAKSCQVSADLIMDPSHQKESLDRSIWGRFRISRNARAGRLT